MYRAPLLGPLGWEIWFRTNFGKRSATGAGNLLLTVRERSVEYVGTDTNRSFEVCCEQLYIELMDSRRMGNTVVQVH
jgi:hypothetical protein